MKKSQLNWGFLGAAKIGRALAPAIAASKYATAYAVASRSREKAETYARETGFERSYGSYQRLLKDPNVDVIYNPLPNHLHCEWTIRALEAGKHVLCEKPMALNVAECRRMIAAAKRNRRLLMEAFMYRLHPQTLQIQKLIEKGTIGEVRAIRAGFGFTLSEQARNVRLVKRMGGGCLDGCGMLLRERHAYFFPRRAFRGYGTSRKRKNHRSGYDVWRSSDVSRGPRGSFQLELSNHSRLGRGNRRHAGTHFCALSVEARWASCEFRGGSKREKGDSSDQEWRWHLPLRSGSFQPLHPGRNRSGNVA